jgi:hypothetical protein
MILLATDIYCTVFRILCQRLRIKNIISYHQKVYKFNFLINGMERELLSWKRSLYFKPIYALRQHITSKFRSLVD